MPFYAQCYPAALFALGLSAGTAIATSGWQSGGPAGLAIVSAALIYYIVVEARWFKARRAIGTIWALASTVRGLVEGFILLLLVAILFKA
jgi:hypothetical protein